MLTPREKLRVCLMFTGILLLFCGAAGACSSSGPRTNVEDTTYRKGAWHPRASLGVPSEVAFGLIVGGIVFLVGSFAMRDT